MRIVDHSLMVFFFIGELINMMDWRKVKSTLTSRASYHVSIGISDTFSCINKKVKYVSQWMMSRGIWQFLKIWCFLWWRGGRKLWYDGTMEAHALVIRKTSSVCMCFIYVVCKYCKKIVKLKKTLSTNHLTRYISWRFERNNILEKETFQGGWLVLGFKLLDKMNSNWDQVRWVF